MIWMTGWSRATFSPGEGILGCLHYLKHLDILEFDAVSEKMALPGWAAPLKKVFCKKTNAYLKVSGDLKPADASGT